MNHYPALLIIAPLLASFLIVIAGWFGRRVHFPLAVGALAASSASSILLLFQVVSTGPVRYALGGWPPPIGIEYYVDQLSGILLAVVSILALLNLLGTKRMVDAAYQDKAGVFHAIYLLCVAGHLGIVVTGDAFNLYVLLEISALSGYALLALGSRRAPLSTLRYLFLGTVGASFYLLGVGFLYISTGSLNMINLSEILPAIYTSPPVLAAFGLIVAGTWVKMAFFPMHSWLPGAYYHAFSPASSLVAPLTTKVMIYVMIRMMLTVFTPEFSFQVPGIENLMVWLAVAAIVAGAFLALAQKDLKRMLTYVIIAEVGYMVGGAWLGNRLGMTGAMLHIVNDAVMTFCVFLAAGGIASRLTTLRYDSLTGLFRKMPLTMTALVIGGLSMIGVPPTCGFFSKWYLILGGLEAGHYGFVAALVLSSLINIVLFFRIFEHSYFDLSPKEEGNGHGHQPAAVLREENWETVAVLMITAAAVIALGLFTGSIVPILQSVIPATLV
ncbi:MAG: complex I subunit 5 family protein [Desulfovibrionales bacterium]